MSRVHGIQIRRAAAVDLSRLAPLFDAYRVFYGKSSDLALARAFLADRLEHDQSVLFIAERRAGETVGESLGFTQLYPSFSSTSVARIFILNDLYVVPEARRTGVATGLLEAAASHGRAVGAVRLSLSTAIGNDTAQALYASRGWVRDTDYFTYNLLL
jgi:GNAT superfamily N-acetyltransferase